MYDQPTTVAALTDQLKGVLREVVVNGDNDAAAEYFRSLDDRRRSKSTKKKKSKLPNSGLLADTIEKNRPSGCKGKLWNTATITSTMGPAIKIEIASLKQA